MNAVVMSHFSYYTILHKGSHILYDLLLFPFRSCTCGGGDDMGYSNGNERVTSCEEGTILV